MAKSTLVFFIVVLLSFVNPAFAIPAPALWVSDLVDKADVIIVGRVLKTSPPSLNTRIIQTVAVTVDQTLKGSAERGHSISFNMTKSHDIGTFVEEGQYGTFFLLARPDGSYEAVEPVYPDIVASPLHAHDKPQSDDPLTEVAIELAWVLATPGASLVSPASGVHHRVHLGGVCEEVPGRVTPIVKPCAAAPPAAWQGQAIIREAADELQTLPYQTVKPQMALLLNSRQELTRMWAAGVLLSFNDVTWIEDELSPLPVVAPFLMKAGLDEKFTRDWIAGTIDATQPIPSCIPTLAPLLKAPDLRVRRDVAHALARINSPAIIEPLTGVLDDRDADVRYFASNGLAFVTKARRQETAEEFRTDGAETVRFWTDWARTRSQ